MLVFDRAGTYRRCWDIGAFANLYGIYGSAVDAHGDVYLALGPRMRVDTYVRKS